MKRILAIAAIAVLGLNGMSCTTESISEEQALYETESTEGSTGHVEEEREDG